MIEDTPLRTGESDVSSGRGRWGRWERGYARARNTHKQLSRKNNPSDRTGFSVKQYLFISFDGRGVGKHSSLASAESAGPGRKSCPDSRESQVPGVWSSWRRPQTLRELSINLCDVAQRKIGVRTVQIE
jgi:hypothetical protein